MSAPAKALVQPASGASAKERAAQARGSRLGTLLRVYRVFWRHYRARAAELGVAYFGLLVSVVIAALAPWPFKLILDHVILGTPLPESARWLGEGRTPMALLGILVGAFVGLRVMDSFFSYLHKVGMQTAAERMTRDIRNRLFATLQALSPTFHGGARTGDLITRLTADVSDLKIVLIEVPEAFVYRLLMIAVHIGLMLWLDWRLALIAFAVVPILWLYNMRVGSDVQKAAKKRRTKEGDMASTVWETVTTMALVQAYGREDHQRARFRDDNRTSLASGLEAMRLSKMFKRTSDFLAAGATCAVLWYGGSLALSGDLLPGTLVLFASYLRNLYTPIDKFAGMMLDIAGSQAAAERLLEIADSDDAVRDRPGARPAGRLAGRVAFEGVQFGYRADREVLSGVDFEIAPGETVAIVGRNGSGKSTLLRLMMRLHDPDAGRVLLDGVDARDLTVASLRANFSVVLQEARLFNRSVRDNIAFGRPDAADDEVVEAARLAEADEFIRRMPGGYDAIIEEQGDNLSGGERQRINIARAIIRNAPIVILDEPTTALDARTEARVRAALAHLTAGKTTFVVAHRLTTIATADRILFLEDRRMAGNGTHTELLAGCPGYRALYESQFLLVEPRTGAQA